MARSRYDDEDDDDRPRRRRYRDDDDDDDRPRRRRPASGGGNTGLLLALGGVGLLVLLGGVALVAILLTRGGEKQPPPVVQAPVDPVPAPQPAPRPQPQPNLNPNPNANPNPRVPAVPKADDPLPPGVVRLPLVNPLVRWHVFAGGADGVVGVVSYVTQGVGYTIDVLRTGTGAKLGRVTSQDANMKQVAVSPNGKWLMVMGSTPATGHPVALHAVADGAEAGKFVPYPRAPATSPPELMWASFLSNDLLLTVNDQGGFDTWSVPDLKRVGGIKPTMISPLRVEVNLSSRCPQNFALTPDAKRLALFNGTGFTFYDPVTATPTGKTNAILTGTAVNFSAAALSADGTRFACFYQAFSGAATGPTLGVWDATTGRQLSSQALPKGTLGPTGFAWWGPKHLLYWKGGMSTADVCEAETGKVVGTLKGTIPSILAGVPPDDKLWGTTGGLGFDLEKGASFLVTSPPPQFNGGEVELSPKGLRAK